MTLIVGYHCADGVVIGADSAATLGSVYSQTIRQDTEKLRIIGNRVIFGVSGHVGLSQRLGACVEELYSSNRFTGDRMKVRDAVRSEFGRIISKEFECVKAASEVLGPAVQQDAICYSVLAFPLKKQHHLLELTATGAVEFKEGSLPFVAIGSGQQIADPFLAFLRKIFWPRDPVRIQDAIFAVMWTLQHVIDIHPGGVGGKPQLATLRRNESGEFTAEILPSESLQETGQLIERAEQHLQSFLHLPADSAIESPLPDGPSSSANAGGSSLPV